MLDIVRCSCAWTAEISWNIPCTPPFTRSQPHHVRPRGRKKDPRRTLHLIAVHDTAHHLSDEHLPLPAKDGQDGPGGRRDGWSDDRSKTIEVRPE